MSPSERFVEVRLFISDRNQKPEDLSLVTGSILLLPKSGPPLKKDFQLMMPEPPLGVPAGAAHPLPDGRQVRVAVADFSSPFQGDRPTGAVTSVYLKADVPMETASKETTVTVSLQFPAGKQELELRSLFEK